MEFDAGAVRTVYVAGKRNDHYEAELELRKLLSALLREKFEAHFLGEVKAEWEWPHLKLGKRCCGAGAAQAQQEWRSANCSDRTRSDEQRQLLPAPSHT